MVGLRTDKEERGEPCPMALSRTQHTWSHFWVTGGHPQLVRKAKALLPRPAASEPAFSQEPQPLTC